MVKCAVSGCPNRAAHENRGLFNRPPKRFFSFPEDPARVKVWLAALRETGKQDSAEQHLICEDHFLPEDISADGVSSDAIPIMPPCLDEPMGMMSGWGAAESSEEEDQWAAGGGGDDDEDDACEGGDDGAAKLAPPAPKVPAVVPQQQDPGVKKTSGKKATRVSPVRSKDAIRTSRNVRRPGVSLEVLTQRFLEMMLAAPDGSLDIRELTAGMQTGKRRVHDLADILQGISLIEKQSAYKFKWIGKCQISGFLWETQKLQRELESLKLVEDTLDILIKSCAQQLFDMTDDAGNAALAYVTHEDVKRLAEFQEQIVIVVKAPEETKLEVPAPKEDSIQVHLKAGKGPIMVLTCDIGTGDATAEPGGCFLTLEDSRMNTSLLHTENPQSAMQSA